MVLLLTRKCINYKTLLSAKLTSNFTVVRTQLCMSKFSKCICFSTQDFWSL